MSKINDGGPAYPLPGGTDGNPACWNMHGGMSVRQWYAGQVLAGLMANHKIDPSPSEAAQISFIYADAMLACCAADEMPEREAK